MNGESIAVPLNDKPPESLLDPRIKKQQNKTALAMFTTGFVSQALAGCELLFHV